MGIVTLAFSQLAQTADNAQVSGEDFVTSINAKLATQSKIIADLKTQLDENPTALTKKEVVSNLEFVSGEDGNSEVEINRLKSNLQGVEDAWLARRSELENSIRETSGRLSDSRNILEDLKDNFAGRFSEAQPALQVLDKSVMRTSSETEALSKLMDAARMDAKFGMQSLVKESEDLMARTTPIPPNLQQVIPQTSVGRNVASVIQSKEAVSLSSSDRFSPSITAGSNILTRPLPVSPSTTNGSKISKLESELAASKDIQTELSEDTAQMQIELRRAYRDIVSLKSNLEESQQMVDALERSKNALSSGSMTGQGVSAKSISDQINRLERELDNARSDLRQSRQSLLMEQERSNSYIRSITTELERTRRELDLARSTAANAGVDSARLLSLERELSQTKNALRMAQSAPKDASARDFLDLQDELRKALGEIARMQVEVGEKDDLESQLLQLKSSLEDAANSSTRSASPAYVNKLLLDLNAAKKEVLKAKEENRLERNALAEQVQELEDKLKSSNLQLVDTKKQFDETRKQMAKREFDFANTIQSLEEDAQVAQEALREASLGKLPAIPFVNEMEQNLEDSEKRIQELSRRFDLEQARATEVIDGLKIELDNAVLRQKRAMEQLSRRELEIKGKDEELNLVLDEKQKLREELEVVKVIAGQLQDLNQVLEETKNAQNQNNLNTDEVVLSLRDELNKVKVELVFEKDENERIQGEAAREIASLEEQLVQTHNKLLSEQENLVNQTDESQDLVLDLKSELDKAREEIARMKTAGLGESVETRQAVSQLQEALGTIRILQESLDEAEMYNAEVDNLKAELADAMTKQIETLQENETEKEKLLASISDLEAELTIMKEEGKGASLETKKMVAKLNEDLKVSQKEISGLQKRLENSDDSSITAVVLMEEELLKENAANADLRAQLESLQDEKSRTIDLLEKELSAAVAKLDSYEEEKNNAAVDLQNTNNELNARLLEVEARNLADLAELEDELADSLKQKEDALAENQKLLSTLKTFQDDAPPEYAEVILDLKNQLKEATSKLNELATQSKTEELSDSIIATEVMDELEYDAEDDINAGKLVSSEAIKKLETDLAKSEATVSELQDNLTQERQEREKLLNDFKKAGEQISRLEAARNLLSKGDILASGNELESYKLLEDELVSSQLEVETLRQQNEAEEQGRIALEKRLERAISLISQSKKDPVKEGNVMPDEVAQLNQELERKNNNISDLREQLDRAIEKLALRESELEILQSVKSEPGMDDDAKEREIAKLNKELTNLKESLTQARIEVLQATTPQSSQDDNAKQREIIQLNQELAELKESLLQGRAMTDQPEPDPEEVANLEEQLQEAVADGLELQFALEETRKQMEIMENQMKAPNQQQYDELILQAKEAEQKAFTKINDLTEALRKSEELRKETENLLDLAKDQKTDLQDVTEDPRYQELEIEISSLKQELSSKPSLKTSETLVKLEELQILQDEMRLLQQDLIKARNLEDPRVAELQRKLEMSREDAQKLNIEFKNAMGEFGKIKDQVTSLENENERLRDVSLNVAKSEADQQNALLQNRINSLSNENSNLSIELGVKENRLTELREQLAQAQAGIPGLTADSAALKAQIIRLEGMLQAAQDNRNKSDFEIDAMTQQLAFAEERANDLEEELRNAQSQLRNLPARLPSLSTPSPASPVVGIPTVPAVSSLSKEQLSELSNLRQENQRLQTQLVSMSNRPNPDRALLDQKIRDLNQRNMSAQIQLDQERAQVASLTKELEDARDIKQEVLDRGRSDAMKVELLNDELANTRNRMQSLENALIGAREAIRVLRNGGNSSNTIQVSVPQNNFQGSNRPVPSSLSPEFRSSFNRNQLGSPRSRLEEPLAPLTLPNSLTPTSSVRSIPEGDASLSMKVEVQFLNNRNRPAGFTEFFLTDRDLDQVLADASISLPENEGIGSYAEYWARSVQRGYRFPGAAASIRNALANESVLRIKTNSLGEANIENVKAGRYFLVGASTLGQVGVVWSKPVDLSNGVNNLNLNLRDAAWAE